MSSNSSTNIPSTNVSSPGSEVGSQNDSLAILPSEPLLALYFGHGLLEEEERRREHHYLSAR
jgi:hypothetical protein